MNEENNIKSEFEEEQQRLLDNFNEFENSYAFCVKYSLLIEETISKLVKPVSFDCVMAAVGSFSRRELSPYSDIDLLFILEDKTNGEEKVKTCMEKLWQADIKVSYTINEIDDIREYLNENLQVFTQFFETRFLFGNKALYGEWNNKLFETIELSDKEKLMYEYFNEVERRYAKYGKSPKTLEPNLKFTGGSLRDIHAAEWMYSIKNQRLLSSQDEITQTELFFKELFNNGIINLKAYRRLYDSYEIILKSRNTLHLIEGRKNDRFTFLAQIKVAEKLGYLPDTRKEIMHDYFEAATILNRFSKTIMKRYKQTFAGKLSDYLSIDLDDDFEIKGDILHFKGDRILSISDIMRAFYYKGMNHAFFESSLRTLIIESIHLVEGTNPFEVTSSVFFRELLNLPANVGNTLRAMNEFGFLDILLPEFKGLNGFYQEGVFHQYTADAHSIIAIENLEALIEKNTIQARTFKLLPSRDLLYLGVLLHDIGKPISTDGHEIIGAEIVGSIMRNLGYGQNEIETVQFLVKHHLDMKRIAFKKDLNNIEVIEDFAAIFDFEVYLECLYLLSYADLTSVNPIVWNTWKEDLLNRLFIKTKELLTDGYEDFNIETSANKDLNSVVEKVKSGESVAVMLENSIDATTIAIAAKHSENIFIKIFGSLIINNLILLNCKTSLEKDNIVLCKINVVDRSNLEILKPTKFEKLENKIIKAITQEAKLEKEVFKQVAKAQKNVKLSLLHLRKIEISFEEDEDYTEIHINSFHIMGLYFFIVRKMSVLGLTIQSFRINTSINQSLITFFVLKNNDKKLRKSEYNFISSELTEEIKNQFSV